MVSPTRTTMIKEMKRLLGFPPDAKTAASRRHDLEESALIGTFPDDPNSSYLYIKYPRPRIQGMFSSIWTAQPSFGVKQDIIEL